MRLERTVGTNVERDGGRRRPCRGRRGGGSEQPRLAAFRRRVAALLAARPTPAVGARRRVAAAWRMIAQVRGGGTRVVEERHGRSDVTSAATRRAR